MNMLVTLYEIRYATNESETKRGSVCLCRKTEGVLYCIVSLAITSIRHLLVVNTSSVHR
jgi:hypothetical protein